MFPDLFRLWPGHEIQEILAHLKAVIDSREPFPEMLVDGTKIDKPEPEDLEYAERWLQTWKEERRADEDPNDVKRRIESMGPKDWSPRRKENNKGITEL